MHAASDDVATNASAADDGEFSEQGAEPLRRHLEFLFSDSNLDKDKHLLSLMAADGSVPLANIFAFRKVSELAQGNLSLLARATALSPALVTDGARVRRLAPFTPKPPGFFDSRTVYVESQLLQLPSCSMETLKTAFERGYGRASVAHVSIPHFPLAPSGARRCGDEHAAGGGRGRGGSSRRGGTHRRPKGFAFIEFTDEDTAQAAAEDGGAAALLHLNAALGRLHGGSSSTSTEEPAHAHAGQSAHSSSVARSGAGSGPGLSGSPSRASRTVLGIDAELRSGRAPQASTSAAAAAPVFRVMLKARWLQLKAAAAVVRTGAASGSLPSAHVGCGSLPSAHVGRAQGNVAAAVLRPRRDDDAGDGADRGDDHDHDLDDIFGSERQGQGIAPSSVAVAAARATGSSASDLGRATRRDEGLTASSASAGAAAASSFSPAFVPGCLVRLRGIPAGPGETTFRELREAVAAGGRPRYIDCPHLWQATRPGLPAAAAQQMRRQLQADQQRQQQQRAAAAFGLQPGSTSDGDFLRRQLGRGAGDGAGARAGAVTAAASNTIGGYGGGDGGGAGDGDGDDDADERFRDEADADAGAGGTGAAAGGGASSGRDVTADAPSHADPYGDAFGSGMRGRGRGRGRGKAGRDESMRSRAGSVASDGAASASAVRLGSSASGAAVDTAGPEQDASGAGGRSSSRASYAALERTIDPMFRHPSASASASGARRRAVSVSAAPDAVGHTGTGAGAGAGTGAGAGAGDAHVEASAGASGSASPAPALAAVGLARSWSDNRPSTSPVAATAAAAASLRSCTAGAGAGSFLDAGPGSIAGADDAAAGVVGDEAASAGTSESARAKASAERRRRLREDRDSLSDRDRDKVGLPSVRGPGRAFGSSASASAAAGGGWSPGLAWRPMVDATVRFHSAADAQAFLDFAEAMSGSSGGGETSAGAGESTRTGADAGRRSGFLLLHGVRVSCCLLVGAEEEAYWAGVAAEQARYQAQKGAGAGLSASSGAGAAAAAGAAQGWGRSPVSAHPTTAVRAPPQPQSQLPGHRHYSAPEATRAAHSKFSARADADAEAVPESGAKSTAGAAADAAASAGANLHSEEGASAVPYAKRRRVGDAEADAKADAESESGAAAGAGAGAVGVVKSQAERRVEPSRPAAATTDRAPAGGSAVEVGGAGAAFSGDEPLCGSKRPRPKDG